MMSTECCHTCGHYKTPQCLILGRPVRRKQKPKLVNYTAEGKPVTCFISKKGIVVDITQKKGNDTGTNRYQIPDTRRRRMNTIRFVRN